MSNSTSTLPSMMNMIQEKLTFIVLPIYIVLGILGNTFCIMYFSQRAQRTSSCALYLLLAAVTNMFAVTFGLTTNILNTWKSFASASIIYCKLRMYINHSLIFIGRMFIILASIDTYAMSSPRHACRLFHQRSNVIKFALIVVFSCLLIAVHIPIMNTIVAGQCMMTGIYSLIFAIYQMFIAGIFPPVIMTIFSCLAYLNMRKRRLGHDHTVTRIKRKQQQQLVRMVTTQIIVYVISAELVPVTTLYKQLTANVIRKSQNRKAIESFIVFIASNFLLYLNTWAPFFIYFGTSSSFRTAFIRMFKRNHRIQPANTAVCHNTTSTTRKF